MVNNLRFELSFKSIEQLENKLHFCKSNSIKNINIPCKGVIKKDFFDSTFEYMSTIHQGFNVVFHYSLNHQYVKNKDDSYQKLLNFVRVCKLNKNYEILLVSGSNKKKNFDVISVLNYLKKEKNLGTKFGVAHNPYLGKYYHNNSENERYEKKVSTGLIKSTWLQFGTDIKLLENEVNNLKKNKKQKKINLFGSILIPSKQFLSRFKFRPWKEVYISNEYLNSLDRFYHFSRDLINFYRDNNITPVIETDFYSDEKLDLIDRLFRN